MIEETFNDAYDQEGITRAADNALSPLKDYYDYYEKIVDQNKITDKSLNWRHIKDSIQIINECGFKSHRSLFLRLFIEYNSKKDDEGKIATNELEHLRKMIQLVESYIVRRTIVQDLPSNSVETLFIEMSKKNKDNVLLTEESIRKKLLEQDGRGIWPSDEKVREALSCKDLYGSSREKFCYFLLERICAYELDNYTERISDSQPTCEHIFPQKPGEWQPFYSKEDFDYLRDHMHRIGNLTPLTRPKNSDANNNPYCYKLKTYAESQYQLTKEIGEKYGEQWTRETYMRRQEDLIGYVLEIWKKDDKGNASNKKDIS
ncbi:MAG: HNH endonuclease [Candidatus Methanomethylophilaceae archaeon]|nr:HNH endonuclease [Candidatus Methanomethylophilaceae archaeon]